MHWFGSYRSLTHGYLDTDKGAYLPFRVVLPPLGEPCLGPDHRARPGIPG